MLPLRSNFSLIDPPPGFVEDPYRVYARLRTHEPVCWIGSHTVLLTRYRDVMTVYRAPAASSDKKREFGAKFGEHSPLFEHHTTSLVFSDPPLHTRVRRLLMSALHARAVAPMEDDLVRRVNELIDAIDTPGEHELVAAFAAPIPIEVIGNLLGIPARGRSQLRQWSLDILSALEPQPSALILAQGNRAVVEFSCFLRDLIGQRRRHPKDPDIDLLSRLIEGEVDGERLSEHELVHQCIFLLNAGHETTTNLIANGVVALLGHRPQWEMLCAEEGLVASAIEECLRYESPLQLNNRVLLQPLRLGEAGEGPALEAGTFVTLGIGAANRDPEVFEDPDRFDICRKANHQLAFGHGPHACAGMNVARFEARVALNALRRRLPDLALAGPPERDPRIRFRGFRSVPVVRA
jgi:cytochrome P450